MKVYILSDYYDNMQELDSNVNGDVIMGVYDTYDKAKQAAIDYEPHDFNIAEDQERQVTELTVTVHMREGAVRNVREYVDEYHMYEHELYITEMELQ
jgi:ketosteroid isomerase-like protein